MYAVIHVLEVEVPTHVVVACRVMSAPEIGGGNGCGGGGGIGGIPA